MHHEVVIIGAGISGLTAAHELAKQGITDVLLLEAQDYVGGRVRTTTAYGEPIEIGAEFVHGSTVATWEYIRELELPAIDVTETPKLIGRDGHEITGTNHQEYLDLHERVAANGKTGVSVADIVEQQSQGAPQEIVDLVKESIGDYEAGDAQTLDSGAYTAMCAAAKAAGENHVLTRGYKDLVDFLAKGLHIRTQAVVTHVDYSDPKKVAVTLNNGEQLIAKQVVVTVSLGVLQHDGITFTPALPKDKQRVITRLGMGRVLKYLLQFRDSDTVHQLFHTADGENQALQTISCWWQSASNPVFLVGYAGGSRHDRIVAMDEAELFKTVCQDLGAIAGHDITDQIVSHQLVRWDTNPFVLGAYSNHPVGVSMDERAVLAAPVQDCLYIAGEATVTSGNYATVHGAIESGKKIAEQIARQFSTNKIS